MRKSLTAFTFFNRLMEGGERRKEVGREKRQEKRGGRKGTGRGGTYIL